MSNQRLCINCGSVLENGDRFCAVCGTSNDPQQQLAMEGVRCPRCGQVNGETDRFCMSCGTDLTASAGGSQSYGAPESKPAFGRKQPRMDDQSPFGGSDPFGGMDDQNEVGTIRVEDDVDRGIIYGGGTIRLDERGMPQMPNAKGRGGSQGPTGTIRMEPEDPDRTIGYDSFAVPPQPKLKKDGPLYDEFMDEPSMPSSNKGGRGGKKTKTPSKGGRSSGGYSSGKKSPNKSMVLWISIGVVALLLVAAVVLILVSRKPDPSELNPTLPTLEPVVTMLPTADPALAAGNPTFPPAVTGAPISTLPPTQVPVTASPTPGMAAAPILVTPTPMPVIAAAQKGDIVIIMETTNIRIKPDRSEGISGMAEAGEQLSYMGVTVPDASGVEWYNVSRNGVDGWVSSEYALLQRAQAEFGAVQSAPVQSGSLLQATTSFFMLDVPGGGTVAAGMAGDELQYMNNSDTTADGRTWYLVSFKGQQGWVNAECMQVKN